MPYLYHAFVNPKADSASTTITRPSNWNARLQYSNFANTGPVGTDAIIRETLNANRLYYVRTDGSDSNNGLSDSAAGAFKTIQTAIYAAVGVDTNTNDVRIFVRAGTYASTQSLSLYPPVGGGTIHIEGDTTTPSNVFLNFNTGGAGAIYAGYDSSPFQWEVIGLKIANSGGAGIECDGGFITAGSNEFGTCSGAHVQVHNGGVYYGSGNYTISGGATMHWSCQSLGLIRHRVSTITLTGTPNFSTAFAQASVGDLQVDSNTFSGSATGPRFILEVGGRAKLNSNSFTYFPGNVAGTFLGGFYNDLVNSGGTLTVGQLPANAPAGTRAFVSDSNATLAAGLGNVVAAGAGNKVPVYSDGTNWRIG